MDRFECNLGLDDELPSCHELIGRMHRYWRDIRPDGRAMPARTNLDPAAIPRLLPTIRLYDVHRDPWRFRYRLIGTELVRMLGRDLTGTWYHEAVPQAEATQGHADLIYVGEGKGISYRRGVPLELAPGKEHVTSERILLPLARDGAIVDMVLGFTVYHTAPSLARRSVAAE